MPPPGRPKTQEPSRPWTYTTIERLFRNPHLAGLTPYQPGRQRHDPADDQVVLRDDRGLPVVNSHVALITLDERQRLLEVLDNKAAPQSRPRSSMRKTSPFLAQAVHCGQCDRLMTRKTLSGRPALGCPDCHQSVSRPQLEAHLAETLLKTRGEERTFQVLESTDPMQSEIARIERHQPPIGPPHATRSRCPRVAGANEAGPRGTWTPAPGRGNSDKGMAARSDTLGDAWTEAENDADAETYSWHTWRRSKFGEAR